MCSFVNGFHGWRSSAGATTLNGESLSQTSTLSHRREQAPDGARRAGWGDVEMCIARGAVR